MILKYKFFNLFLLSILLVSAQSNLIDTSFRSPIGIPLNLSGDFGELRSNHFHTGLDIKTNGKTNYKMYAIQDGFVSRINISHWGYGKAIYVDHPNGYTSVYAHLSRFPEKIEKVIREYQYQKQNESVTLLLDSSKIPVTKSEVIAYSGNTGSSSGPHLHFEIRETKSEKPVNPLLFNFVVPDHRSPLIRNIKFYPLDGTTINNKCKPSSFKAIKNNGIFILDQVSKITFSGPFGVGVDVVDYFDNSSNKCGVYSIKMYLDNQLKFSQKMDKLDFSTNRDINIHKDYVEYHNKRRHFHKSFIHHNNKLEIYDTSLGNGVIHINDSNEHEIKYVIKDFAGNKSIAKVKVIVNKNNQICSVKTSKEWLKEDAENSIQKESFKISLPSNALYDSVAFNFQWKNEKTLKIMNKNIPLREKFILSMKLGTQMDSLFDKAFIAEINSKNRVINRKGEYKDGWVSSQIKSFGNYQLMVDTKPPIIQQLYFSKEEAVTKKLTFKITDNLSGLQHYNVWIDDVWVLSNYSFRNNRLIVPFDKYCPINNGTHSCRVEAIDERNNISELKFEFTKK